MGEGPERVETGSSAESGCFNSIKCFLKEKKNVAAGIIRRVNHVRLLKLAYWRLFRI